jgi:hypothetical protein
MIQLNQTEKDFLAGKVAEYIVGGQTNLMALVKSHATRISAAQPPIEYGHNVVEYCILLGWVENPTLLEILLTNFQAYPIVANVIQRLRAMPKPVLHSGRPSNTALVSLQLPFIGREITRQCVDDFLNPQRHNSGYARVLIVNGEKGTGKTFTYNYLQYVNVVFTIDVFKTLYIDFKVLEGGRLGPKEFAQTILQMAGIRNVALPVLDVQQPARWNMELAKSIAQTLSIAGANTITPSGKGILWFLVLDNFNDEDVPHETLELIQLLSNVATGELTASDYEDRLRIVLLSFDNSINNFKTRVVQDKISMITKKDLETYFKRYCEFKEISPDQPVLDMLVDKVLQKDPGNVPERNKELAKWALLTAENL